MKQDAPLIEHKNDFEEILTEEFKDSYINYRKAWEESAEQNKITDFPVHLDISLNDSCNLNCVFCVRKAMDTSAKKVMDDSLFEKIIDESKKYSLMSVNLSHNNEPLMKKNFADYVRKAKSAGIIDIMIHTNGYFLNEEMSAQLIDAGLTRLNISIDAFTAEIYEKIRIGSDLHRVKDNINRFLQIRGSKNKKLPVVRVNFLETNLNSHELNDFMEYWQNPADQVFVQRYKNPCNVIEQDYSVSQRNFSFRCSQPFQRLAILPDGDVSACCADYSKKLVVGNVYQSSIYDIWSSSKLEHIRSLIKAGKYNQIEACRACVSSYWTLFILVWFQVD